MTVTNLAIKETITDISPTQRPVTTPPQWWSGMFPSGSFPIYIYFLCVVELTQVSAIFCCVFFFNLTLNQKHFFFLKKRSFQW